MEIVLRDYQKKIIKNIVEELKTGQRCCVSLATGGGKTVIFSELVNILEGNILICVHREELVHQTSATLKKEHDILIPKIKKVDLNIVVAMVQTLHNRIKKNEIDLSFFDYIIVDECHRGEFMKILNQVNCKVIGFTATPNYEKTRYFYKCLKCGNKEKYSGECCNKKLKKYKENIPLSEYYHTLIEGISISELIEKEYLVQDEHFVLPVNTKMLVFDFIKNDYTEESISLVFGSDEAIQNTINNYLEYCNGLKTMIFNPNTLVNKKLYTAMIEQGINAKMYDSNNSDENRIELVNWFKNTKDAVLLNVHVFTTGFDVTDVECIFLNKKTKSINLFIQMVGRGGRITNNILKPSFKVIDLGNNAEDFGSWSDNRNWNNYFYNKITTPVGTPLPTATRDCHICEAIIAANSLVCTECGAEREYKGGINGLAIINGKPVMPKPYKIIEYCEKNDLNTLQATKIVFDYFTKMFVNTSIQTFYKNQNNGNLFFKSRNFLKPYYFAIQKSKLEGNRNRTIDTFINKAINEVSKTYNK